MFERLKERLAAIPSEVGHELKQKAVLGGHELGGLWTGNAYRGDLAMNQPMENRARYQESQNRGMTP